MYSCDQKSKSPNFSNPLYQSLIVLDPGSANRLYIEGFLNKFKKAFIASSSSKKLAPEISSHLVPVKLNMNDKAKAITMKDSCNTFEEAGLAFIVCKKKHCKYYISSYQLPKKIMGIEILSVHEIVKSLEK